MTTSESFSQMIRVGHSARDTVEMLYTSFEGWTADQTIKLIGNGRDFAALEEDADWYNNCDAKIILVDEQQ